jgi:hypothetical protein
VAMAGLLVLAIASCAPASDQDADPLHARCAATEALDSAVDEMHDASTSSEHIGELEEDLATVRVRLAELDAVLDADLATEIAFVAESLDAVVNAARRDRVERADLAQLTSTAVVDAWGAVNALLASTDEGCP